MQVKKNPHYQALDMLSRRDHSVHEVAHKLKRKGFSPQQIATAIAALLEQRLLNDARFAQVFVDSTLRVKSVGPRWLQSKLRQRGIAPALIAKALTAAFPPGREAEVAREAAAAWRRAHPQHATDKQRLWRFLASRGFSTEAINNSIDSSKSVG